MRLNGLRRSIFGVIVIVGVNGLVMMKDSMRFECIYDEGDWIVDNDTGEYLSIEEACGVLNDLCHESSVNRDFWRTVFKGLDEANGDAE